MKKIRFTLLMAAIASVVTFSSCLNTDDDSNYPMYRSVVTVGPSAFQLYSDNGSVLRPTQSSLAAMSGLASAERSIVAFDMADESLQGKELEPNKEYDVILRAGAKIPTAKTVDLYNNSPADTLVKNMDPIESLNKSSVYGRFGYLNAELSFSFKPSVTWTMNAYYNSEKDVDVKNRKFTMTLCYDKRTNENYQTGVSLFSFRMPSEVKYNFMDAGLSSTDSVDVVLRYKLSSFGSSEENSFQEVKTKMALSDFNSRRY